MTKIAREALVATAKEMNEILDPKTKIDVKASNATEAIQAQMENLYGSVSASDFQNGDGDKVFSEGAVTTFKALGWKIPTAKPTDKKDQKDGKKNPPPAKGKAKTAETMLEKAANRGKAKEKGPTEKRFTRSEAVAMAIRKVCVKGATLQTIMDTSDKICVEKGLNSNPTATNVNTYMVKGLVAFGILELKGEKYTLTEKGKTAAKEKPAETSEK